MKDEVKTDELDINDIELVDDVIEVEEDEEEIEVDGEEDSDVEVDENDMIPKGAMLAERKKNQKRIKELELKLEARQTPDNKPEDSFDEETQYKEIYEEYLEDGLNETTAARKARREVNNAKTIYNLTKQVEQGVGISKKTKYDIEFEKLSEKYEVDGLKDELVKEADRTGWTLEQVHRALYGSEEKLTADQKRIIEQREIANRGKKKSMDIKMGQGKQKPKPKKDLGLSNDELEIAKAAGMSPSEYALSKKGLNVDDYNKLKPKPKKE